MAKTGGSGKEYSKNPDGSITVNRPDGSSSTVSPGDKNWGNTVDSMHSDGVWNPGGSSSSGGGSSSGGSSSGGGGSWQGNGGMISSQNGMAQVPTPSGSIVTVDISKAQYGYNFKPDGSKQLVMITPGGQRIPMTSANQQYFPKDQSYGGTGNFYYNEYMNPITGQFESGAITGGQGYKPEDYYGMMGIAPGSNVNSSIWFPDSDYKGTIVSPPTIGTGGGSANTNKPVDMGNINNTQPGNVQGGFDYAGTQNGNTTSPFAKNAYSTQQYSAKSNAQGAISRKNQSLFGQKSIASM